MRTQQQNKTKAVRSLLALAAAAALGPLAVTPASAATCTWNSTNGNWNELAKWLACVTGNGNPAGAPGSSDTANIGATGVVTINTGQSVLNLNNAGHITIDAFGLNLVGGGSTANTGVINVGGASTANIGISAGHNLNNTGGVINIAAGSVVNQFGSTISGGTVNTSGTGKLVAFSNAANFLSNVTLNGVMDMTSAANSRQRLINTNTVNGSINVANGGILSLDSGNSTGSNATLGGNAIVNLNDSGARLAIDGTGTATLGANVTVRGQGNIGQALNTGGNNTLTNNGLISADVSGGTLNITAPASGGASSFINNGTLQAVGGGTLLLSTNILSNTGSQIVAGAGSSVVQNGVRLNGVINASGGGIFTASSNANNFLDGVTFAGNLDLTSAANSRERIVNGATFNGAINVANGGILSLDSANTAGGNQALAGNVTINLNDAGARLSVDGTGSTTLGSTVIVRGQGNIGQALNAGGNNVLTNNGLISADVASGTLNIAPPASGGGSSFINNGTLQAINGATLLLSTNITSNVGSQIIAGAGSSVVQNGVTLNGVINASGTGVFTAISNSNNFLNAVNFTGALDLTSIANSRERIINGATFNGAINVGNGGILSLDSVNTSGGNQTLAGNVTINLNDAGARLAIDGTGSTTLASTVVVRGQGNIGQALNAGGNNVLTNNGLISADVASGTLNIAPPASGGGSSFINNGTLQAINGATLLLSTNITSNVGSQIIAGAGSSVVQNGVTLNGVINASGTGVFTAISNSNNFLNAVNFTGALDLTSIANSRERIINGATFNGAINVGNGGILSLDSVNTSGGNQTLTGNVTINLNDSGARLSIDGTGSTTLASGVVVRGQGDIGTALNAGGNNTLVNNGRISADVASGTLTITPPASGGGSSVTNNGVLDARGGGTLVLASNITNTAGQINALSGSIVVQSGITITGGTLGTSGTGVIRATSNGNNILTGITLSSGSTLDLTGIANARDRIITSGLINGAVNVANGGILSLDSGNSAGSAVAITGTGVINLNDPGARLSIEGSGTSSIGAGLTVRGQGNIGTPLFSGGNNTLSNNGVILADGGTLTIAAPASGGGSALAGTGTLQVAGGAMVIATGNASTQGKLVMGASGSLGLGTQNLTITNDYTNAQAGSGNSFDRRAGVTGTGQILAGANAAQVISGAGVTGGNTTNATLTLGNLRVGTNTYNVNIGNSGSTGPTLRGAIQTSVNGGNITDTRLGGSGVTASNYNAGGPSGAGSSQVITFNAASAGALAPLSGQAINLRSNFENIADQKLNIVLTGGAAAYNAAAGSTVTPVQVANQRVGGSNSAVLAVSNTAVAGAFSEDLNATVASFSGAATASGSISGRTAGSSSTGTGAITVGVNTASAGAQIGLVTLNYQTAGAVNGVSNGLGVASAGSQAVTVNGNVYQAATGAIQTAALNFGTVQVGQSVSQALVIRNTASGAAGFVEDLNAGFGATSGIGAGLISGSGSLNGILAGANSTAGNGSMVVSVNTGAAANINGSILVSYTSAGAVGGVSNGLGTLAAGSDGYGVTGTIQATGNVINQASPLVNNPSINLGAVRVGAAAPSGTVSVTNVATAPPQAALNAAISPTTGPITASGSFNLLNPGATNNSSLVVGLNTGTAGNFTGANAGKATISFVSDANNVGNCSPNCQLNLASQMVNVEGKVYTQAVGQLATTSVNFGIVRVGDTVSARQITVNNAAAVTALNDTLRADLSGVSGPFSGNGSSVAGVAPQGSAALSVGLNTSTAGVFSQGATVGFKSQNPDMADVSAGANGQVQLLAQVNNLANGDFDLVGGQGTLSQTGTSYTLDLGTVTLGNTFSSLLALLNDVVGPADVLFGSFNLTAADDFSYTGWNPLAGLAAGQSQGGLAVNWLAGALGAYTDTIIFNGLGVNGSGPNLAQTRSLTIRANVVNVIPPGTVPEPGTLMLLLAAAGAGLLARRRTVAREGAAR